MRCAGGVETAVAVLVGWARAVGDGTEDEVGGAALLGAVGGAEAAVGGCAAVWEEEEG